MKSSIARKPSRCRRGSARCRSWATTRSSPWGGRGTGRRRSEQRVSESYIVKEAVEEANSLVRRAEAEATRIRLEAEDYSDQAFEQTEAVRAALRAHDRR